MIRAIEKNDFQEWKKLYLQYGDFYQVPMNDHGLSVVWSWIHDPSHAMEGLVLENNSKLIGLAHFRKMPNPLRACEIGFLDDLFVDPKERGSRFGEALIEELVKIAIKKGWPKIRWITADNNYRARTLYDRVAKKTQWITYEIDVER